MAFERFRESMREFQRWSFLGADNGLKYDEKQAPPKTPIRKRLNLLIPPAEPSKNDGAVLRWIKGSATSLMGTFKRKELPDSSFFGEESAFRSVLKRFADIDAGLVKGSAPRPAGLVDSKNFVSSDFGAEEQVAGAPPASAPKPVSRKRPATPVPPFPDTQPHFADTQPYIEPAATPNTKQPVSKSTTIPKIVKKSPTAVINEMAEFLKTPRTKDEVVVAMREITCLASEMTRERMTGKRAPKTPVAGGINNIYNKALQEIRANQLCRAAIQAGFSPEQQRELLYSIIPRDIIPQSNIDAMVVEMTKRHAPVLSIAPEVPPASPHTAPTPAPKPLIEAEATAAATKVEATVEAAASRKPNWLNRIGKGKVAAGSIGALGAVGVGVWAWKEYVAKPEALPHHHTK